MLLWSRQDLWLHAAEHILGFNCRKTYKHECICLYHWPLPLSWWIYLFLLLPVTYFDCKYFIPYLLTKFLLPQNFFYSPFHTSLDWVTPNLHEAKCAWTHQDEVRLFPSYSSLPLLLKIRRASFQPSYVGRRSGREQRPFLFAEVPGRIMLCLNRPSCHHKKDAYGWLLLFYTALA